MTADWFLFWQQNNERPEVSWFDLEMDILAHGLKNVSEVVVTAVMPALVEMTNSMEKFLATATQARTT